MNNLEKLDLTYSEIFELKRLVYMDRGKTLENMQFFKEHDNIEGYMIFKRYLDKSNELYEKLCFLIDNLY